MALYHRVRLVEGRSAASLLSLSAGTTSVPRRNEAA